MSKVRQNISANRWREFVEKSRWYHTFDLGDGLVTAGTYDLRPAVAAHRFPDSLKGKSVLDVGTSDGFYAFEFERRGADSVLAVDVNPYDGSVPYPMSPAKVRTYEEKHAYAADELEQFADIYERLGLAGSNKMLVLADYWDSRVQYKSHSVYELEKLGRAFDFVFCGALIEHLKDPLKAVEQLRLATKELCIVSVSSAMPISKVRPSSPRMKLGSALLRLLGVRGEFSVNAADGILRYVGNKSGGSFFHMQPDTFREMCLASGFRTADVVGEFDVANNRRGTVNHNVVFHCRV